jgi:hypothetical protein
MQRPYTGGLDHFRNSKISENPESNNIFLEPLTNGSNALVK